MPGSGDVCLAYNARSCPVVDTRIYPTERHRQQEEDLLTRHINHSWDVFLINIAYSLFNVVNDGGWGPYSRSALLKPPSKLHNVTISITYHYLRVAEGQSW